MAGHAAGAQKLGALVGRLGLGPQLRERVAAVLDRSIADAERRHPEGVAVLDAGCGHRSPLVAFRRRITTLVGVDVHAPEQPLPYLDSFSTGDLCDAATTLPVSAFDLVLSNFTLEHFPAPGVAIRHFADALRPGGALVLVTVNRRHPFVAAYLGLPNPLRRRLQRTLKASAADAHPLVGACNDPAAVRAALDAAGLEGVIVETVPNLARAWKRHRATRYLGLAGDVLLMPAPTRRSTIIATAHKPNGQGQSAEGRSAEGRRAAPGNA